MKKFQNDYDQDMPANEAREAWDKQDEPMVLSDYLPWYYRGVIWVANNLMLYSTFLVTAGVAAGYYLTRIIAG